MTEFYKDYGVGMFGLNKAFRIAENKDGSIRFLPINNMDTVMLDDLIGYELQKKKLVENTQAFCDGKAANNVLLFGDSGTGKSTSIKAIVNQFYPQGLRMIEIYKHQFKDLSTIIAQIKNRNYKFIIYMDDLSFEEFEIEYKFLKAVIEGGVETKPDNVLIYATSNRRHLIKETWKDREDMEHSEDLHRSDTMEEKLSLVNRFGLSIFYAKPNKEGFNEMAVALARRAGITPEVMTDEEGGIVDEFPAWAKKIAFGQDFGYTHDPSASIRCGIVDNALYLDEVDYRTGLLSSDIIKTLRPWGLKVIADSADPRLIQEIHNGGIKIYAVEKGAGSINAGIDKMKDMEIYITKRSYNLQSEFRKYVWAKDKDGNYINEPEDHDNHGIDAVRYYVLGELLGKIQKPKDLTGIFTH